MNYLDSHCHINDERLLEVQEAVFATAKEEGVNTIMVIGWDLESSELAVKMAEAHEGVYAAIGFHPENLEAISEEAIQQVKELTKSPKVIAIGEIGLDYHWFKDPKDHENQKKWFIRQIDLANELDLPISIHARECTQDMYDLLKEHPLKRGGVLHCYSGSAEMLPLFAKLGLYFGFDGPITYKNAKEPVKAVEVCPLDRILSETDSPYLPPVPHRGERNEPKYIPIIVSKIAEIKKLSIEETAGIIEENFKRLFLVKHRL